MADLAELQARREMCAMFIQVLSAMDDPRAPGAMEHYKAQLAEIDAKIAGITGKPPDVVVGLKPALISGSTPK